MDLLAIAPAGDRFAEAGANRNVRIRDLETPEILQEFRVQNSRITGLARHPSKPIIATASEELEIRLWDLKTRKCVAKLRGSDREPTNLAFSPDGSRLAASGQNVTRIWDLDLPIN